MNWPSALALLLLLLLPAPLAAQQPLVICTTLAPPLSTPEQTGMLDAIVLEAFRRAGSAATLAVTPSERGLLNANSGAADGDINRIAGLSKSYPNLVQVPESNMRYEFMAFTKRPDLRIRGWESLKPLRVGYIIGWKIFEEHVQASSVTRVATAEQLFSLLASGRVDVALCDRWGGAHSLRAFKVAGAAAQEPPLATRDMHLYLNVRHAELAPRLAAALRAMKADGSHAAIVARFRDR